MSEDVSATPAGQIGGSLFGEMVHSKMWRRARLFSVVAGVAALALHLSGEADSGKLQDFFRIFDAPLIPLLSDNGPFSFLAETSQDVFIFFAMVAVTCYWAVIVLSLASLFCLVRIGALKRMLGDRTFRRDLLIGICGGIFIAGLNLLAFANGWVVLQGFFDKLDRPAISLLEAAQDRSYFPANPTAKLNCWRGAVIMYWFTLGLLFAFLLCVFKKREAQVRMSGE